MSQSDEVALDATLDEFGILRYANRWVALTPAETTALTLLLQSFGRVVSRTLLSRAVWPDREPTPDRRSIHVLVFRLRKRIEPLGLAIATIRGQGFMLHEGMSNG